MQQLRNQFSGSRPWCCLVWQPQMNVNKYQKNVVLTVAISMVIIKHTKDVQLTAMYRRPRPDIGLLRHKGRWIQINSVIISHSSSSYSIGTATLMGFGLLNYRSLFSAGRFLQSAVASGTSNPQLVGSVIRTFQLPPPCVPHAWNDASEPQQRKVELWARNFREFCRKWRLPRHFWILLHAVNLRHGTDGFTSPPKKGVLRIFSPEKSDGFGRVWTRELGYQRPARSPLDNRSR